MIQYSQEKFRDSLKIKYLEKILENMKKFILLFSMLLFSSLSYAGYYVCYNSRTVHQNRWGDNVSAVYYGCHKSRRSCRSRGRRHFGRYGSRRAQNRALQRCLHDRPKYISR